MICLITMFVPERAADRLFLSRTPPFGLGDEPTFLSHLAQDAVESDLFPKPSEQLFLGLARS